MEGERKAVFEDCESEKATNKEKIKKLKAEVKKLQVRPKLSGNYYELKFIEWEIWRLHIVQKFHLFTLYLKILSSIQIIVAWGADFIYMLGFAG